jgi:adenosylcobinamide-phosphate synthase
MRVEDAIIGGGRRDPTAADIRAALSLYIGADAMLIALLGLLAVLA